MVEAYKVGITIALTNQISRGLMLIQGDLAKTDAQAKKLHATLGQIKKLGIAGAILGGAGYAGLHALGKTLDAAKEYQQALGQFKAINLGDAVNKDADKFARGSSVIGASATDLIKTVRDLHTAMGDYGMAKQLAPQIAQMKYANEAVFGGHGMDFGHRQLQAMEKIVEMRGGFKSPTAFLAQADMMQKVISGTGGMVKPTDYMQFIQTAGVAGRLLTDENFYYTMEPLIQEMHAGRVGTGTMSAYNNLAQGKSTVRSARELMKFGLLDPHMVEYNKIGMIKSINPGALKGMGEFTSDPYHWMKDVLLPALAASGITSESAVYNELGAMFGNRTGSNLFSLMFKQQDKIEKNVGISKNAMNTRELYKLALTTPDGAEKAMGAAWTNLKIAAGESLWPVIIPAMNKFAEMLRDLGKWINQHPVKFDYLIKGFAGLSAALLFSGALLTLKAAFLGLKLILPLVTTPVTGLGSALMVFGASAATAAALLTGAAAALGLIVYHKEIADKIDGAAPGIGDSLLAAKNFFTAPIPRHNQGQQTIIMQVDKQVLGKVTTGAQTDSANRPATGPSGFDGRMGPIQPAWGW